MYFVHRLFALLYRPTISSEVLADMTLIFTYVNTGIHSSKPPLVVGGNLEDVVQEISHWPSGSRLTQTTTI